ncbi:MAG: hypothetical protein J6W00_09750 [Lentisphaeria bacterium]|nr:hypothetical protein [Lentisphaeria bacterium]
MKLSELKLAPADLTMEVMDMFYQARRDLLTFHPFCGAMSMSLQALVIRDSKMKNSCTDGKTIYLDGEFFKEATAEHRMLIIAHNVWHCALHHSSRRQKRPTQAFDYAADLEVDLILHKDGFNFQVLDHDTAWHGLSVEQLCDKLPQYIRRKLYWDTHTIEDTPIPDSLLNLPGDEEGKDKDSSDKNNDDSDEQSEEQSPRDNDSEKQSDKNPQKKDKEKAPRKDPDSDNTDDGDDDNSGDNGTGDEYDPKSRNKIGDKSVKTIEKVPKIKKVQVQDPTNTQSNNDKSATPKAEASGENGDFDGVLTAPPFPGQQWQKIVNSCTAACQGRGTLPGFMSEALELKKKTTLSWQELLREYLTMRISSNRSWTRPNRRHIHRDLYLPGILKQPDVEMVVAIDTSGSTHEYLGDFLAELHAIFSSFTNYKVTLIQCDTEINKVDEFSTAEGNLFPSGKEQKNVEFKGFGGTDLCPPFDYVKEKSSSDIQCLVYFTDGFGPTPQEAPDYPVIWVLVPDGVKPAKWGEEVYIQKGKKNGKQ